MAQGRFHRRTVSKETHALFIHMRGGVQTHLNRMFKTVGGHRNHDGDKCQRFGKRGRATSSPDPRGRKTDYKTNKGEDRDLSAWKTTRINKNVNYTGC